MYTFETNIRFSEVDETARLSIPAIVDLLQDCSTFHSDSLGMGPAHAAATGRAWMISGWEIEVLRRPRFNERVRVATWATGFKGIRATRDFAIHEAGGEAGGSAMPSGTPLVYATSNWFMFDTNLGAPIRLPQEEVAPYLPDLEDKPLGMPPVSRHIVTGVEAQSATPVTITGAHLDTNHHVNNAQYVSLALGALEELSLDGRYLADGGGKDASKAGPLWIDVRYAKAARRGNVIYPHIYDEEGTADERGTAPGSTTVSLDNADGTPYAQIRLRR